MAWSEDLFQKAEAWLGQLERKRKGLLPTPKAACFHEMKSFIQLWTALVSGRSWSLQEAETWPATDGVRLFFPPVLEIFDDQVLNRKSYLYIACFLLGFDELNFPELSRWRQSFQKANYQLGDREFAAAVQNLCCQEGVTVLKDVEPWDKESFRSLINLWHYRKLPLQSHSRRDEADGSPNKSGGNKIHKKKAREQIQVIESLDDQKNENPLVHSFEKLHTTDDYNGGQKKHDGDDEMDDHADSLEDLDLRQVIRTTQQTLASLKGDYVMDVDVAESQANVTKTLAKFQYDEWNEDKGSYHKNWCTLESKVGETASEDRYQPLLAQVRQENKSKIDQLTRFFFTLFKTPKWKNRLLEGSELDLDSLVEMLATPVEKRPDKMNIYMSQQKSLDEMSVIFLLDRSLSSDSWVDDRRVLDVIRDSFMVIGEAIKRFHLPVQLAAFSSQTRNKISYEVLKDFHEDWQKGLKRLSAVEPTGYTRIGPALRHGIHLLKNRKSKHKWIILLSDSKPTDFDKYEGRYGVRDVKKAIHEARLQNIGVRCLSIDKVNRAELCEMYGARGFELLHRLDQLPERLGLLLKSLAQKAR